MLKKIVFLGIVMLFLCACGNVNISKEDFLSRASFNGYIIENNKKGYEKYTYIRDVYYAVNRENAYDIQLLEIQTEDLAKRFFEINKAELKKYVNDNTYIKSISWNNYNSFHIETDDKYMLVIQNNNLVIYIDAPINYINEIEEFLDEIVKDY